MGVINFHHFNERVVEVKEMYIPVYSELKAIASVALGILNVVEATMVIQELEAAVKMKDRGIKEIQDGFFSMVNKNVLYTYIGFLVGRASVGRI